MKTLVEVSTEAQRLIDVTEDYDGYTGEVLNVISALMDIDGQELTDHQVLAEMHILVNHWSEVIDL
jgi:hypothetical protein